MTPLPEARETPATRGDFACHELAPWAEEFGLAAGITNRGPDFGLSSPEPAGTVLERWRAFRTVMQPAFKSVIVAHQCHGSTLVTHGAEGPGWRVLDNRDGHLTSQPGILLTVTVADCVPVYLAQRGGPWIGLLHAGWRGIGNGIIELGISKLSELASCSSAQVVMHCGVSVCGQCYEVGPEVYEALTGQPTRGKCTLDLRALVAERARRHGIGRITTSPWCTAHDSARFYSHRRSGGADGRMVAYLGRPSP